MAQESSFLGISSNTVSRSKAAALGFENTYGRYVVYTVKQTAAERMGLRPFDYLVGMNGQPFSAEYNLHDALGATTPGESVQVDFVRAGRLQSAQAVLGTRSQADRSHRPDQEDPFLGVAPDHNTAQNEIPGVPVRIVDCSTAEAMGMQDGDVIQQIDDFKMIDWHDIGAAVNFRAVGDPIRVVFVREGRTYEESLPIKSEYETENADCNSAPQPAVAAETPVQTEKVQSEVVEIEMEDVTSEEAEAMKRSKGIDMPVVNNLEIERLKIFPNPSSGIFNLQFELPNLGNTSIRLFNSSGRLIYQSDLGPFSGDFSDRIDLTNNFAGTYFLEIRQDALTLTQKLIVIN